MNGIISTISTTAAAGTVNMSTALAGQQNVLSRGKLHCLLQPGAKLPERAHRTDAGADLFAYLMETPDNEVSNIYLEIPPGEQKLVDTGVAVKIPEGFGGFVFNRSSQGKKGITIPHSVGVIDSDYRGTIKVILKNLSDKTHLIKHGDRIAQLVLIPIAYNFDFVDTWNDTARGSGGFGSTGT